MIPAKRFYMIRHGETEANAARIMAGSLDSPLTETGRMQARAAAAIVGSLETKPEIVVHSHLSRARETARIINEALNVPMIEDDGIAELHAGDWEGVSYDACADLFADWIDPPNGETFNDFSARVRSAKSRILSRPERAPLIVSHGGVFRAFGHIYGIASPGVPNCRLFEFEPREHDRFPWRVWTYEPALMPPPEGFVSTPVRRAVDIYELS